VLFQNFRFYGILCVFQLQWLWQKWQAPLRIWHTIFTSIQQAGLGNLNLWTCQIGLIPSITSHTSCGGSLFGLPRMPAPEVSSLMVIWDLNWDVKMKCRQLVWAPKNVVSKWMIWIEMLKWSAGNLFGHPRMLCRNASMLVIWGPNWNAKMKCKKLGIIDLFVAFGDVSNIFTSLKFNVGFVVDLFYISIACFISTTSKFHYSFWCNKFAGNLLFKWIISMWNVNRRIMTISVMMKCVSVVRWFDVLDINLQHNLYFIVVFWRSFFIIRGWFVDKIFRVSSHLYTCMTNSSKTFTHFLCGCVLLNTLGRTSSFLLQLEFLACISERQLILET
jgi:hypothetical protein